MNMWIALLRGINVGGRNILPMKELRKLLNDLSYTNVQTYIQSGNCMFRAGETNPVEIANAITNAIDNKFEFRPAVHVLDLNGLQKALTGQPYPQAMDDPKSLHIFFLTRCPSLKNLEQLRTLCTPTELMTLSGDVLYFYAPDGIGRSKAASRIETILDVAGTGRNLRTVLKLVEMADAT